MMLAYQIFRPLFFAFPAALLLSCHQQAATSKTGNVTAQAGKATTEKPAWLQQRIAEIQQDKPANPPIKIYSYQYKGQLVYFITSRCCDIPSEVYTVQGQQLCQPDGGFTGKGDGKCPDYFQTHTAEKLIWEDLRK
jgi:hypothetical protein